MADERSESEARGASEANLAPGTVVGGRYIVEGLLGVGGLAEVYRVRHVQLGSEHALKLLTWRRKSLAERLIVEGQIQANLRHPNVVAVTDLVEVDGQWSLLMEYVDGTSLEGMLAERGKLSVDDALAMFAPVLAAVAWAHERGVLHRDLKPANVLLARTPVGWVPKVADFGIAKLADDMSTSGTKTRSGVSMGTPGYMAPEQVKDSATIDKRADVFALGAILFEMIAGRQAFLEPDGGLTLTSTLTITAPRLDALEPSVSTAVADALEKAMANDREQRWPDVRELALALGLGGHPLFAEFTELSAGAGGRPLTDRTWSRPSAPPPRSPSTTDPSGPFPTLLPPEATLVTPPASEAPSSSAAPRPAVSATLPPSGGNGLRLLVAAAVLAVVVVVAASVAGGTAVLGLAFLPGQRAETLPAPADVAPVAAPIAAPVPAPPIATPGPAAPTDPAVAAAVAAVSPAPGPRSPTPAPTGSTAVLPVAPVPEVGVAVEPVAPVAPVPAEPAPTEPEPAVADLDPEPAPAPPDPMEMLGTGVWKGTASGRPLELRFTGAAEGVVRAEAVYVTGPTRRVEQLTGSFDAATRALSLRTSDGKVTYQGTLSGGTLSGTYMQQGGRSLAWTASR